MYANCELMALYVLSSFSESTKGVDLSSHLVEFRKASSGIFSEITSL